MYDSIPDADAVPGLSQSNDGDNSADGARLEKGMSPTTPSVGTTAAQALVDTRV